MRAEERARLQGTENDDDLSNTAMHTIPFLDVVADQDSGPDGQFDRTRVTTTVSPVVVRQHNLPSGPPVYQEALGYSFLLNSPKCEYIADPCLPQSACCGGWGAADPVMLQTLS